MSKMDQYSATEKLAILEELEIGQTTISAIIQKYDIGKTTLR